MYISIPTMIALWVLFQTMRNPYYIPNLINAFWEFMGALWEAVLAIPRGLVNLVAWAIPVVVYGAIIGGCVAGALGAAWLVQHGIHDFSHWINTTYA
ncbi:hypothetical protein KYT24_004388 [Salmonella enterica]|nr:hypothetical protein [Salmonella enterica]